jgi:hydrogenase 3 maturation protease
MNSEPGTIKFINKENLSYISTSTHSMSLSFLIKYLENDIDFKFMLVGIEPVNMELDKNLSKKVLNSIELIKNIFISVFN